MALEIAATSRSGASAGMGFSLLSAVLFERFLVVSVPEGGWVVQPVGDGGALLFKHRILPRFWWSFETGDRAAKIVFGFLYTGPFAKQALAHFARDAAPCEWVEHRVAFVG